MRYRWSLTVPAGTLALAPVKAAFTICPGIITEVEVFFPAGSAGTVYGQVWYHERVIFPSSPDMAFRGDDTHITFNDRFPVLEPPFELELRGWAPSATLDHTFFVEVSVRTFEELFGVLASPVALPEGFAP